MFLSCFGPFLLLWLVAWGSSGSSRDSFKSCLCGSVLHAPWAFIALCTFHGHLPSVATYYSGSAANCGMYFLHASGSRNLRGPSGDAPQPGCVSVPCSEVLFSCSGVRPTSPVALGCLDIQRGKFSPLPSFFTYCGKITINQKLPL